jgi:hypothetical protein
MMNESEVMEFEWCPTHFYFEVHGSSNKVLEVGREYGSDQIWATIHADGEPTQYLDDFESVCANWSDPVAVVAAVRQIATTNGLFDEYLTPAPPTTSDNPR